MVDELDSLLRPALGPPPQSLLASSATGPTSLLSQLLNVPDDIDSLVQAALSAAGRDDSDDGPEESPVETVLYTIGSDNSSPSEPRIVVEAEVIRAQAFDGQPTLQVRFVGDNDQGSSRSADLIAHSGSRPTLGYRPSWTPTLVRTPAELAEQMRVRWRESLEELQEGVDPRMTTFLTGVRGMETALAVLASGQSPTSKFILLQGLMDPEGQIQYKGLGLDASTFAGQIRAANERDEDALIWLEEVQREGILTSLSEVTGISLAAEADYRLSRWQKQGMSFINAVTTKAEKAGSAVSNIQSFFAMRAQVQSAIESLREQLAKAQTGARGENRNLNSSTEIQIIKLEDLYNTYGIAEDWFFEETRLFLQTRFRESLPARFAAALVPASPGTSPHAALAGEVRRLAASSSIDPRDYATPPHPLSYYGSAPFGINSSSVHRDAERAARVERIIQAVRRANAGSETAGDDDLGTFIVAQEVLGYAQWKREELRAKEQIQKAEENQSAAAQRTQDAKQRAESAKQREEEARGNAAAAKDLEQVAQRHFDALARTTRPVAVEDPVSDIVQSTARDRVEQAQLRQTAASERLLAAEEREQWAAAAVSAAATPDAQERLLTELDSAVEEQQDAIAEQDAAAAEEAAAQSDIGLFSASLTRFEELIQGVREENERRVREELKRRHQLEASQAAQRRQRAEELIKKQEAERQRKEAAIRHQEGLNQRQQDRANAVKKILSSELERLLALPDKAPFWRRKALAERRASLQRAIVRLQAEIVGPVAPPRTRSKTWPNMLSHNERYLGSVKKRTDYGVFVTLPANSDGLLRGSEANGLNDSGQLVAVEIVDMPVGKPIVLKRIFG